MKAEHYAQWILCKPVADISIYHQGTNIEDIMSDKFGTFESELDLETIKKDLALMGFNDKQISDNVRIKQDIEYSNYVIKRLKYSTYEANTGLSEVEKINYHSYSQNDKYDLAMNHKEGFKQFVTGSVETIPSQYRPESISQFCNIPLYKADEVSKAYADFNFNFDMVKKCNNLIKKRINPVSKMKRSFIGCSACGTLTEFSSDLEKTNPMPLKHGMEVIGNFGYDINGYVIFEGDPLEIEPEVTSLERQANLITYSHRIGKKENPIYKGSRTLKASLKILSLIWKHKFTRSDFIRNKDLIKSFTPSQKREIKIAWQDSLSKQA